MLLAEILKQKNAGVSVSHLLSGEKQTLHACDLNSNVLLELRRKLWLVLPEQYETTCECCGKAFAPIMREGALAICTHCGKRTVVADAPPGIQWIRCNSCFHVENWERGPVAGSCGQCGAARTKANGKATYTGCSVAVPKKADTERQLKERTIREIEAAPWTLFPRQFVVNCIWKGCHKKFIPTGYDNYCLTCTECNRPNPTIDVEHKKWVYYKCAHLKLVPAEGIPEQCPECGGERGGVSSLAKPVWNTGPKV